MHFLSLSHGIKKIEDRLRISQIGKEQIGLGSFENLGFRPTGGNPNRASADDPGGCDVVFGVTDYQRLVSLDPQGRQSLRGGDGQGGAFSAIFGKATRPVGQMS